MSPTPVITYNYEYFGLEPIGFESCLYSFTQLITELAPGGSLEFTRSGRRRQSNLFAARGRQTSVQAKPLKYAIRAFIVVLVRFP